MHDFVASVEAVKKVLEKQKGKDTEVKGAEAVKQVLEAMKGELPDVNMAMVINARDGRFIVGISNEGLNLNDSAVIYKNVFATSGDAEVMSTSKA